jgi:Spy/CpxP family protein refolding chaperone
MIERTIKGKLLVFSVFFLGIVSGVLMTYAWETRVSSAVSSSEVKSADRAKADVNKFYDYLGLNPEQRVQVKQITEDSRPEFNKIFQQTRPQMEAMQKQTRNKIRAVLTDEQKKKYDDFYEARRNKQKPQPQHSN